MPGYKAANAILRILWKRGPRPIAAATAPATQQITQASTGAKQNILNNAPAGGEKNLALENVDVNQGAQVGKTASEGYLNSFNALGQLSQTRHGSIAECGWSGMSGYRSGQSGIWSSRARGHSSRRVKRLERLAPLEDDAATLGGDGWAPRNRGEGVDKCQQRHHKHTIRPAHSRTPRLPPLLRQNQENLPFQGQPGINMTNSGGITHGSGVRLPDSSTMFCMDT